VRKKSSTVKAKPASITQILQMSRAQLSLHLISLPTGKGEFFQILQQLFVRIGIPLSSKNIAECQGRGARALESLLRAYKLQFTRIARQLDKTPEGDRLLDN
jgi:hypothetical protein